MYEIIKKQFNTDNQFKEIENLIKFSGGKNGI
jgi:hypothetical protein